MPAPSPPLLEPPAECTVDGVSWRIELLSAHTVRIRASMCGAKFGETLPERWGFVRPSTLKCAHAVRRMEDSSQVRLETPGGISVVLGEERGCVSCHDASGAVFFSARIVFEACGKPRMQADSAGDEHFHGFGFQRTALDARGHRLVWKRDYRSKSATVPFFLSSRGYGFYSNNTWEQVFDFTRIDETGGYTIEAAGGEVDFFILHGPEPAAVLERYTALTGRPQLPPRWALGLCYIARYYETQDGLLEIARAFRAHDIPCDSLGLEPGWEAEPYSMKWQWCPHRFPDPAAMVRDLSALGYKLELWESGDAPKTAYTDPETRRRWYVERVAASLALGVRWFKQDDPYPRMIHSTEMNAPEFSAALADSDGFSPAEVENLANSLYSETAFEEYRRLSGDKRALILFHSYMASVASHRWPTGWAGDFPSGPGLLNAGVSGHAMVSLDMRAESRAGIHFGYLTPFTLIDSWAFYQEPWVLPRHLLETHRFYAKLRRRLAPYLYSSLAQAHRSGLPLMRALLLEWPDDPQVRNLTTQHLLGDFLLVGQSGNTEINSDATRFDADDIHGRLYVPAGDWFDFWTGRPVRSRGEWMEFPPAGLAAGPLLVRAGAILPLGAVTPHLEAEPESLITLDVWPGSVPSSFELYEDDGDTHAYECGAWASTMLRQRSAQGRLCLEIGQRTGNYAGMPPRAWLLRVHLAGPAVRVHAGGEALPRSPDIASLVADSAAMGWCLDEEERVVWVKPHAGWKLESDVRGANDPERDTVSWASAVRPDDSGFMLEIEASAVPWPERPCDPAAMPVPDRIALVANPPARVALKDNGPWLPHKTTLWAEVRYGEGAVPINGFEIQFEAIHADGRRELLGARPSVAGRAVLPGIAYEPGLTRFVATGPGLHPGYAAVEPAAPVVGME